MTWWAREYVVAGGGGVALRVVETGDPAATPVVLVHGWSQDVEVWAPLTVRGGLARDHRVVAFDLRGHGRSGRPPVDDPASYDDGAGWADDLAAVLDHVRATGVEPTRPPTVVCWSYAGLVLGDHLARHGTGRIGAVALLGAILALGTPAAADTVGPAFLGAARRSWAPDDAERRAAITEYLDLVVGTVDPGDPVRDRLIESNEAVDPAVRRALFRRRLDHVPTLADAATAGVPVTVLHGDADPVVLPVAGRAHAAAIPGATLVEYPGAGHAPFVDHQERVAEDLRSLAARAGRRT